MSDGTQVGAGGKQGGASGREFLPTSVVLRDAVTRSPGTGKLLTVNPFCFYWGWGQGVWEPASGA